MQKLLEYGVAERLFDIFRTLSQRDPIPAAAYLVLDLLDITPKTDRLEEMRFLIELSLKCKDAEEFERFLLKGISPQAFQQSLATIRPVQRPISHLKLSFWAG